MLVFIDLLTFVFKVGDILCSVNAYASWQSVFLCFFPQLFFSRSILSFTAILYNNTVASSFVFVHSGELEICTRPLKISCCYGTNHNFFQLPYPSYCQLLNVNENSSIAYSVSASATCFSLSPVPFHKDLP